MPRPTMPIGSCCSVISFAVAGDPRRRWQPTFAEMAASTAFDKALIVATLVLVWTFGNAVYALHYAHLYYSSDDGGDDRAGLEFPGKREPDYADFVYFAFTLGVALQTADVCDHLAAHPPGGHRPLRRGFFFNLGVLALTINVLRR